MEQTAVLEIVRLSKLFTEETRVCISQMTLYFPRTKTR